MDENNQMTMEDYICEELPVIDNVDDISEETMEELKNGYEENEVFD